MFILYPAPINERYEGFRWKYSCEKTCGNLCLTEQEAVYRKRVINSTLISDSRFFIVIL